LLQKDLLAGSADGGELGVFRFEIFKGDAAFGEFVDDDFV